jgi:hypothetical protein
VKLATRTTAALSTATLLAGGVLAGGVLAGSTAAWAVSSGGTSSPIAITKLSTGYGSTAGGTAVLITGTGFNRIDPAVKTSVSFATKPATSFMVISDTQISATAPAGTGTAVQLKVTDGTYASADSTADDWTYLAPVKAAAPASTELSAAGGTVVRLTISGPGSIGATSSAFTLNKVTATVDGVAGKLAWVDATHVDLTAPAGIPSKNAVKVVVSMQGVAGTPDTTNVRYDAVVTKLSATTGKVTGTTGTANAPALTITGVGLANATGFTFGSVKGTCTAASGKASTTWTCVNIPAAPAAGTSSVLPTFSDGTKAGVTAGAAYTYSNL